MFPYNRRLFLEKLLRFGAGFTGLVMLNGCTAEYVSRQPICEEGPFLKLLPPDAGLTLFGGDEHSIRWVAACVDFVRIEFSRNNGINWVAIAEKVRAAEGQFSWEVPQISSELTLFRLVEISSNKVLAISDAPMVLIPKLLLVLKNHPELSKVGGVLTLDRSAFGLFSIVRTGEATFKVLNLNCTHSGCPVDPENNGESWLCPCHGSQFSKLGCVLRGPARRPLSVYDHKFDANSGQLVVYNILSEPSSC